jgi:hypothetical protein
MKLYDMRDDDGADPAPEADAASYPAGLRLDLDDAMLDRLELEPPAVGDRVSLEARATVVAYAEHGETCRIELQITRLGIAPDDDDSRMRRADARLDELAGRRAG